MYLPCTLDPYYIRDFLFISMSACLEELTYATLCRHVYAVHMYVFT